MAAVTAVLVGFVFVCIVFPRLVRVHAQFYAAFAVLVVSMAMQAFTLAPLQWLAALGNVAAFVLLVLATGGLSLRELSGEFARAFDAIGRGDRQENVIVPLSGEQPATREEPPPPRQAIDPQQPAARRRKGDDEGSIPLE